VKRTITLRLTDAEIQLLREVIDGLSIAQYAPLILSVLPALPLENEFTESTEVSQPTSVDSAPAALQVPETAGGFLT
jgi:hypothetical protein